MNRTASFLIAAAFAATSAPARDPVAPPASPDQTEADSGSQAAGHPQHPATLASLFSNDDYPASALRAGEQGTVAFRLGVGADGNPSGCTVTASSGSAALDSATCRLLLQRARFTPARDAHGNPVPDTVEAKITWRISAPEPPVPVPASKGP